MKILNSTIKMALVVTAFLWLVGCVQTKPIPGYAKNGDIIVLGLGGIKRNANSSATVTAADLTITLTDSAGMTHSLQGLRFFKSYPDYSSKMNTNTLTGSATGAGLDLIPFDGGWFVTVPLTQAGTTDVLLSDLAIGPATISVTSPKLSNTMQALEGDLTSLPIEGSSSFDGDYNQQFSNYGDSEAGFLIAPNDASAGDPEDLSSIDDVGGAYFVINYTASAGPKFLSGAPPMVVPSGHHPFVQLSYNVIENPDGSGQIIVTLLNPAGFTQPSSSTAQTALLDDLSIKLIYFPSNGFTAADFISEFSVDAASTYYIDTNGAVITDLVADLSHASTL